MKISEMIRELKRLKVEHGDLEVTCKDSLGAMAETRLDVVDGLAYETTANPTYIKASWNFPNPHIRFTL